MALRLPACQSNCQSGVRDPGQPDGSVIQAFYRTKIRNCGAESGSRTRTRLPSAVFDSIKACTRLFAGVRHEYKSTLTARSTVRRRSPKFALTAVKPLSAAVCRNTERTLLGSLSSARCDTLSEPKRTGKMRLGPSAGQRSPSCFADRLYGKLKVGGVTSASVDDMPAMVVGRDVIDSGHRTAQQMMATDDEPQLLARIQRQPDREKVDVHADDLSWSKLLDAIKAVDRHAVRRVRLVEMP